MQHTMGHTFEGIATVGLDLRENLWKILWDNLWFKSRKTNCQWIGFSGKNGTGTPHIGKIYGFLMFPVVFPLSQSND